MSPQLEHLLALLKGKRFFLQDEKVLQGEIEAVFQTDGLAYLREEQLTLGDRIDFLVGSVGVEIKIAGTPKAIYKQCERYCDSARIEELLLVSNKPMRLPPLLQGKSVRVLNLGLAWL